MEIAVGMMGFAITILGIIMAYIWKSNGNLQRMMMAGLERMEATLERVEQGQQRGFQQLAEGQRQLQTQIAEGQRQLAEALKEGLKYLADLIVLESKKGRGE